MPRYSRLAIVRRGRVLYRLLQRHGATSGPGCGYLLRVEGRSYQADVTVVLRVLRRQGEAPDLSQRLGSPEQPGGAGGPALDARQTRDLFQTDRRTACILELHDQAQTLAEQVVCPRELLLKARQMTEAAQRHQLAVSVPPLPVLIQVLLVQGHRAAIVAKVAQHLSQVGAE